MRLLSMPYNVNNITGSLDIPILPSFETHMLVKVQTEELFRLSDISGAYSSNAYDFNSEWSLKSTGDSIKWLRVYEQLQESGINQKVNLITVNGEYYLWRDGCYVMSVLTHLNRSKVIADVWQLQLFPEVSDDTEYYGRDLLITEELDSRGSQTGDLASNTPLQNLSQSIKERLMTAKGELPEHQFYGSELYKLIGTKNLDGIESEAEFYVADAVYQDPRVDIILLNKVKLSDDGLYLIIDLKIKPIYTNEQLNIIYYYWLTEA